MHVIRIRVSELHSYGTFLDLRELLPLVAEKASQLNWAVQMPFDDVWDLADPSSVFPIPPFPETESGWWRVSWEELCQYAHNVQQVIDGLFVAFENEEALAQFDTTREYGVFALALEAFDSTYWSVYAHDLALLRWIAGHFKQVEFLEVK